MILLHKNITIRLFCRSHPVGRRIFIPYFWRLTALEPVVRRICNLWLRMHGYSCGMQVVWDNVNLQDEVELARAALYAAQAKKALAEAGEKGVRQ